MSRKGFLFEVCFESLWIDSDKNCFAHCAAREKLRAALSLEIVKKQANERYGDRARLIDPWLE